MRKIGLVLSFFVAAIGLILAREVKVMPENPESLNSMMCSEGWRTTGYFTPIETDYSSGAMTEVEVRGAGR